jgi:hypothetical protein
MWLEWGKQGRLRTFFIVRRYNKFCGEVIAKFPLIRHREHGKRIKKKKEKKKKKKLGAAHRQQGDFVPPNNWEDTQRNRETER